MTMSVTSQGLRQLRDSLTRLADGGVSVAAAAANAWASVLDAAAKTAAPGRIDVEIGKAVRVDGDNVSGMAGLMKFPQRGDGRGGPHGYFVDQGTRFIQPRHFIGKALVASLPRAAQAAKNAGFRTAHKIAERR